MGLMRGSLTGVSNGLLYLCMYGTYGLAFWYGSTLVFKEEIDVGDMMTTFFGIVIGAFAIGTVSLCKLEINELRKVIKKIWFYSRKFQ